MKKLLLSLVVSCAFIAPQMANAQQIGPDDGNLTFAYAGSWYNVPTSGQGFDVQTYPITNGTGIVIYWYTFSKDADPAHPQNGKEKLWFLAQGTINGNEADLVILNAPANERFNTPAVPNSGQGTEETIGTMKMILSDCNTGTISWDFTNQTLVSGTPGADAPGGLFGSATINVNRLTPVPQIDGQNLCSTPLSTFDASNSNQAYNQCVSNLNSCTSALYDANDQIDQLETDVSQLQYALTTSYNDGYSHGYTDGDSDGYSDGYSDGESDGYSQGYSDGYNVGYNDGYSDGSNSCIDDGSYSDGYNDGYSDGYYDGSNSCTGFKPAKATNGHKNKIAKDKPAPHKLTAAQLIQQAHQKAQARMSMLKPARAIHKPQVIPANTNVSGQQLVNKIVKELEALKLQLHNQAIKKSSKK